jgi:hypothetical protein
MLKWNQKRLKLMLFCIIEERIMESKEIMNQNKRMRKYLPEEKAKKQRVKGEKDKRINRFLKEQYSHVSSSN